MHKTAREHARERPLSICYVLPAAAELCEPRVASEIRAMRQSGHHIVAVTVAANSERHGSHRDAMTRGESSADRLTIRQTSNATRVADAVALTKSVSNTPGPSLLRAASRVASVARQKGCSHIHAHGHDSVAATGIAAARMLGVTSSFIDSGHDFDDAPDDLSHLLSEADIAFATCPAKATAFTSLTPGVNARTVMAGIDPQRFVSAPYYQSNQRLLTVGDLVPHAGYEVLLDALSRIAPLRRPVVDIVGIGPLEVSLRRFATTLGVSGEIRFLGTRSSTWIAGEGPRYQGYVTPNLDGPGICRTSGLIMLKQALAMGLPVLGSRPREGTDAIDPAWSRAVAPGHVVTLSDGLEWLSGLDARQRYIMGAAGREYVLANHSLAAQAAAMTAAICDAQSRRSIC